ncbi:hypothetical protein N9L79_06450 [Alphaproteobacteria bacterium]|nr:hypothetical protein [Alphaproteobacteria bacterium]
MKILIVALVSSLSLGGCISNPNTLAMTGLCVVGGGLLGQGVGQGKGRRLATGIGTILAAATGNHVGTTFDSVTHNRNAINRNQLGINQLREQQQQRRQHYDGTPMIYQAPVHTYHHSCIHICPINFSVRKVVA